MAFVSYDSYKNRIEKLAKFKNFVVKYKFLIMGVLAVIIGGVSALMATKGMITEDIVLADTFTYGQSYAPTAASAFLSGVEYEYSLQGSDEWTDKKPVKVGKYSVRAVTDKVIGNGYGKTLNFEILPAEITFTFNNNVEASLTYGSDPSKSDYSYSGLVPAYGDSVRGVVFDYDYPEAVGEDVGVTLKKLDIRAGDEDRSECYVYKTPSTKYKFAAKSVSFKLADASETYDGKAFAISGKPDSYTQNLLVNGDKFVMNTKITDGSGAAVAPVNAGSYRIEPDGAIKVVDGSGKDVTYRYDVSSPVNGTFTVNRRPVTLLSETEEWIYDGLTHSNDKYKITSGSLADGQSIIATSTVSVTDVSDGTQYNALSYEIYGNGTPVTDNYALTKNYGTLKVKACPLFITTAGDEWEYDGAAHPVTSYTAEGLVSGQTLTGLSFYSETAINVSDSGKNTLSYGIVWGQSGEEVNLSNYNITSSYGDIKITARPLKVDTGSDTRAYNGEYLSCKSFTVTYAGDKVGQTNAFINDGEDLSIVGSLPKIINVGKKENAIGFAVPNGNYYLDETKTQNGVLEITPAEITVTLSDVSCDYGDKLPAPAYTLQVSGKYGAGLFGGDTFTPAFLYDGAQSTRLNIGTHGITLDKANCAFGYGNSETVTEANYEIINSPTATLTVGSRTVTVTLNDTEVTYGNEIKYAGDYKSADGLVSGQTLTVSADKVTFGISSTMPDADVYYDVIACPTSAISVSENGADVTQNYVITVVSATLTVTQREITVKANDMTGIIYGEKIEYEVAEGNYANTPDLVSGEKLTIENVIKNFYDGVTPAVGEYTLTPDVNRITIVKEDGNSSRGNYKITSENGRLEIVKRPVKIQSATNLGFIYDGTAQYDKGFEILLDVAGYYGVLPEHSVDVTAWRLVTDVGEAVPNNNVYAIKDQSGKPVTGNYDITHVYGELKVNKREITVELLTYSATYGDSYAYKTGAGNYANVPDLASGETLEITAVSYEFGSVTRPDASETPYLVSPVDYKILKADGSDSKANYTVNGVVGSVTIEKRAITVELLTYSATYGDSYAYKTGAGNYANVPDLASGETLEITAVSYEFGTVDYPDVRDTAYGVYLETYKILKTDGTGNNNNYTVTAVDGALTVTRRAITVTLNDIADTAYGETVTYAGGCKSATNVLSGHTVTVNAVADDMTFSPAATYPDAGKYTFSCDGGFISVSTEDTDVTGNYSVTVTAGNLEITKREITVTLLSYSREYGEDYSYPKGAGNYANTPDLAEGETLEVTTVSYDFTGSYPTVGSYAISTPASLKILKADGINGSDANYSVKLEKGELTVTKKTITVQFEAVSMYYGEDDYRKQSYSELYSTEIGAVELPYNHALTLSFSFTDADGNAVTPKAVGEYNAIILNGETDNYVIVPEGTPVLQIERRLLHPDPYSKTEVYGATEFEYQSGKSNCDMRHEDMYYCLPAYGEEIELFVGYDLSGQSMPAVGLYNAICTGVRLHYPDGSYTDVAHINGDFEIGGYHVYFNNDESQLQDKLEITPREIKVTLNDIPDAVYGDTIVYTAGGETATNIVEGQTLTVDPDGVSFESENGSIYPNVGEYAVKGSKEFIKIFSGETEVTSNYKVTQIINGTLTINARKITVSLSPVANITYGDDLPVPVYTTAGYGDLTEGLVNGDEIKPTYVYKKAADDTVPEHYNAGNYKIYLDGYEFVYANGAPATIQNYEVIGEISPVDFDITKRKITITLKDFSREYGQNRKFVLIWHASADVEAAYSLCDMEISDLVEIDGLVEGESVRFLCMFVYKNGERVSCKNVGYYEIELRRLLFDYVDGEYFGASRNYEWDAPARATLTITPKDLTVNLGDLTATYGDDPFKDYSYETTDGLAFKETLSISKVFAEKDGVPVEDKYLAVGNYTLNANPSDAVITDESGNAIENGYQNYNITFSGSLTINKRPVTVTLNDIPDAIYGDEIEYISDGSENAENLLEVHKFEIDPAKISFTGKNGAIYPNVGEYSVTADEGFITIFSETDGVKEDVTANYDVKFINGTLTINVRKITVSLNPVDSITYGDELPVPEYTTAGYGDLVDGLVNGDEIKPTYVYKKAADDTVPEHYDAGNYKIYLDSYEFTYANGAPATTQNYEIVGEISPADLEITKRKITVTLKDFSRVYGQNNDDFLFWDTDEHTSQGAVCDMDINDLIEIDGLVQGERVQYLPLFVYETGTYTYVHCKNVGTYDVELSSWSLDYGDGEYFGASRNYEWDAPARATLEITKKAVVAELGEIKVTYGDKDNALSDYTVRIIGGEIPFGESIKITDFALVGWQDYPYGLDFDYRLDVGSYRIDPYYNYDKNGFTVYDEDGAENIYGIDNYSLTVNGTLVIEKREVELSVIPFEKEGGYYYGDGESLVYATGIGNFEGTPDLAYGQQLEVAISWLWNGESIAAPKNAGVYSYGLDGLNSKIYGEDGNLKEGGVNNYSFTCDELSLVINKFGFSVNLGEDNESCYGDELEDKAGEFYPAEFAGGALPYNEKLEIAFEYTSYSENPEVVTPKDAGEYLMRYLKYRAINSDGTVSDADNYVMVEDKGGKLIITQREITVTAQSLPNVIYGFEVTYPVEVGNHGDIGGKGLPADEYLTITSVVYYDKDGNLLEGAPLEAGTYYILPASVEIHSANGGKIDIDKNYIVSYPALPDDLTSLGTVTVLPVKLLLETNTHTDWIYSGAYQYDTGYTLWYLDEDGNKLEQFILPEEEAALVVVGTYTKVKDVCQNVENVVEYDFSATNYSIAGYEYGLLTVTERTITLITPEFETVYDGNSHTPDDYEIINKIEGHAYSLKFTTAKDVTVTDNVIVINDILDEDGYSVFDNYAIEYDYGTIAVKPRPITLQSASDDSFIYDGEEHFNANYEQLMEEGAYSLVAGHRISVTDYTKVRTVMQGAVDNVLTYKIEDTNDGNRDVTGNYKITPINGTLKVNPAHITLALNSYYGLIYGETVYPDELNNYDLSNSTALAGDDELKVAVKFYDKADEEKTLLNTIRNAGAYGVVLNVDGCFVQTSYGTENGFGNYVVDNADTAEAEVTVLPKQITVNLLNLNKVYGEEFEGYPANVGNYETDDALAYDDTLQVAVSYPDGDIDEYTTVGSFAITVDYVSVNGVSYGIGDTADFIDAGNYKITFINGTVTVAPRPVTIATGSAEKVYDGKYLYSPEATEGYKVKVYYKNSLGGVPDGIVAWDNVEDVLQFVSSSVKKIINAETIDNKVEYSLLSSNYELAVDGYFYGKLTVNKRPVNVVLSDIENQTYGTPLTYPDGSTGANFGYAEDTEYKLVEGESLILKVKFKNADGEYVEAKAVGVYTYEPDLKNSVLTGSIGGAGADNYIVTSNDEKSAEIEKLYVKIALDEWATAVYNGDAHEYEGAVNIVEGGKDGKFAYGETFNLAVNYYSLTDGAQTLMTGLPENAGDYVVKYDALNSTIDGYAPDKNYLLEGPEDIFFTISPKNITVSMGAESHTYDGTVYDYPTANHNFKVSGVVTGETIVPSVSYYADEALGVPATPKTVNTYYVGYDAFTVEGGNGRAENYNLLTDADGLKCRLDIVKRDVSVSVTLGADSIELGDELPEIGFESASLGAFGFVNEDLASITPVYTYYIKDGGSYTEVSAETVNKNIGEYKIEVSFAENGVLGNYDITERVEAYLEVTARKVVIAPCAYADVVYNGQPIPTDGFTYEHFHKGYEPEAGFAEGDEPSYKLQFTPEKGVPSYDAPVNAGKYTVKFVFEGIDESRYMVYNEETVSFNILPKPVSVTLSGYDKSKLDGLLTYNYSELPEDLVTASTADIIAGEASTVEWYYDNADYGEVRYNYAGDYTVNARVVTAAGNTDYNYTVTSIDEVTFTVKKSDIYVTPIGEREDYTYEGQTLSLTRFKIWEEYGVLYGDDTLSVTGSGVLKTTRMLPVTIKKVTIMQSGRDVTGCYAVHCRYEEGSPVAEENFRAMLQFNPVKIYYEQAVLDDAHRYFEYTGRPHDLGVDKNNLQNYVTVRNPQDFVGSYRLQYVLATVNAVREYEKWIQILVFDGNGNNVTSLYDLTLLNAEASKIVVHGDDFGITGLTDEEIKTAWENKDGAGSLLSESQYGNGYYVLDSGAYGSTGLKVGHECEVLVREVNGALEAKVIIFTQTANGRVESCMTYSLNPAAGLTITLSYIGQLRAPTTN